MAQHYLRCSIYQSVYSGNRFESTVAPVERRSTVRRLMPLKGGTWPRSNASSPFFRARHTTKSAANELTAEVTRSNSRNPAAPCRCKRWNKLRCTQVANGCSRSGGTSPLHTRCHRGRAAYTALASPGPSPLKRGAFTDSYMGHPAPAEKGRRRRNGKTKPIYHLENRFNQCLGHHRE